MTLNSPTFCSNTSLASALYSTSLSKQVMTSADISPTLTPPKSCSPVEPDWSLDTRLLMLLVMLAAFVFLLLLYRLLQLRHRLSLLSARNALEYYSCYRSATYTPKHCRSCDDLSDKKNTANQKIPCVQNDTAPLLPTPPVLPPPPLPPSSQSLPLRALPLPVASTPSASPHLSWTPRSDVEIYSQVGAFRSSSGSRVIWFEHASL